jgi:hypothetical protein
MKNMQTTVVVSERAGVSTAINCVQLAEWDARG